MVTVPIILNARNLFTYMRDMVAYLTKLPDARVIILDNQSSYQPLLDWYNSCPVEVIRLTENLGKFAPWKSGLVDSLPEQFYVVTDPDLDLTGIPIDVLDVLRAGSEKYNAGKVGLSLRLDDIPADSLVGSEAVHWERQFWTRPVDERFYDAPVDTTFAMYNKGVTNGPQLRAKPPYMARHLPWYLTPETLTDEYRYYLSTASSVSDWGVKMKRRNALAPLSGRYVTFTFDDGDLQTAIEAHRIMEPDHATFYIVTGWVAPCTVPITDPYNQNVNHGMFNDWRALAYWGHDIGSHTVTHCTPDHPNAQNEYRDSLAFIKRFGVGPYSMSMPYHKAGPVDAPYDSIRCGNSVHYNPLDVDLRKVGSWTVYPDKLDEIVMELSEMPKDCFVCLCLHGLNGRLCHPSWSGDQFMRLLDSCRVLGFQVRSMAEITTARRMK